MTNAEIDAAVAEKVLGWQKYFKTEGNWWRVVFYDAENDQWYVQDANYEVVMWPLPEFSVYISYAWLVVEWLDKRGHVRVSNGDGDSCDCDFIPDGRDEVLYGQKLATAGTSAETWPLAICMTALKAVGFNEVLDKP